jgi:hypothetical protein
VQNFWVSLSQHPYLLVSIQDSLWIFGLRAVGPMQCMYHCPPGQVPDVQAAADSQAVLKCSMIQHLVLRETRLVVLCRESWLWVLESEDSIFSNCELVLCWSILREPHKSQRFHIFLNSTCCLLLLWCHQVNVCNKHTLALLSIYVCYKFFKN